MQVCLTEWLQIIKVVRMLYGVEVAKQLFEASVNKYLDISNYSDIIKLPRDTSTKECQLMATFVTALEETLTPDALWGGLVGCAALIGTMVLFAFGYRIVKRLVQGVPINSHSLIFIIHLIPIIASLVVNRATSNANRANTTGQITLNTGNQ